MRVREVHVEETSPFGLGARGAGSPGSHGLRLARGMQEYPAPATHASTPILRSRLGLHESFRPLEQPAGADPSGAPRAEFEAPQAVGGMQGRRNVCGAWNALAFPPRPPQDFGKPDTGNRGPS